ncbi:MAG: hypothetical protein HY981_00295 [Candidatus Magasanikbacteria bacterium]|nr:hypothetical protein [Candidatus Magasanikbacteria bacterium]
MPKTAHFFIALGAVVLLSGAGCAPSQKSVTSSGAPAKTDVASEQPENTESEKIEPVGEKKEESSDSSVKAPSLTVDVPGVTVVTEPVKKTADTQSAAPQIATITYDDNGFSPTPLTVKMGTNVTFKNNSSSDFWPASAVHPTHEAYPGSSITKCETSAAKTIFDACAGVAKGTSWTFIFKEKGSWNYHDHLKAGRYGKVVVE